MSPTCSLSRCNFSALYQKWQSHGPPNDFIFFYLRHLSGIKGNCGTMKRHGTRVAFHAPLHDHVSIHPKTPKPTHMMIYLATKFPDINALSSKTHCCYPSRPDSPTKAHGLGTHRTGDCRFSWQNSLFGKAHCKHKGPHCLS